MKLLLLLLLSLPAYGQILDPFFQAPPTGGGGFTPVASGGADGSCRGLGSGGGSFTCVKDTTTGISSGNAVYITVTYTIGDTPAFAAIGGGATPTVGATGTLNATFGIQIVCGIAGGSATSVTVSGFTNGFIRIRWMAVSPAPASCTANGSQGSDYVSNGTAINTLNTGSGSATFSITAGSFVVAGIYGINNSTAGITPAAGWSASTVGWSSGQCDNDGSPLLCLIYKTESGTSTTPAGTQVNSDGRMAAGAGYK